MHSKPFSRAFTFVEKAGRKEKKMREGGKKSRSQELRREGRKE